MCMRVYVSTRVLLRSCMWRAEKGGQELLLQRGRGDPPQGSLCGGGRRRWRSSPPTSLSWKRPHLPGSPARGPRPERLGGLAEVPQPVRGGTQREATVAAGAVGGRPVQPRAGVGWSGRAGRGAGPRPPPGSGGLPGAQPRPGAPAAACAAPAHAAAPPSLRPVGCSAPAAGTRPPEGLRSAERKARLCGAAGGAAWAAREPERRPRPAAAAGRPGHVSAGERSPQRGRPQPLHNAAFVGPGGAPVGMNGARAS